MGISGKSHLNGGNKKTNHIKFSKKLTLDLQMHVYVSGCKKCSFFGKLGVLCFLVTSFLRFALSLYYRQFVEKMKLKFPAMSYSFKTNPG